jgi:hypothetical protein
VPSLFILNMPALYNFVFIDHCVYSYACRIWLGPLKILLMGYGLVPLISFQCDRIPLMPCFGLVCNVRVKISTGLTFFYYGSEGANLIIATRRGVERTLEDRLTKYFSSNNSLAQRN